ncbi:helix-turn-helix transcriptional regulator [Variovorax sp. OK605]|uniref:helix-turn-helix domain-containing protein n=1 Tax=Variovorax sp. OK605 TaxID=1855317 RepID=UPI000B88E7FF|nr:helix-turn-helix transcriptional regulator [Variovorax sp. OK605]
MTTLRTRSGSEWLNDAELSFLTSEVSAVVETNRHQAQFASEGFCLIVPFKQLPVELTPAPVDDFAALLDEVENSPEVNAGRQWVAETFYRDSVSLAALRLKKGLSQAELGRITGLEQSHISRYESGKHEPGLQITRKLANALAVSMDSIADAWMISRQEANGKVRE